MKRYLSFKNLSATYFFHQKGTLLEICTAPKGPIFDVFDFRNIFNISTGTVFGPLFSPSFISVSADGSVLSVSPKPNSISFLNLNTLAKLLFLYYINIWSNGRFFGCCMVR